MQIHFPHKAKRTKTKSLELTENLWRGRVSTWDYYSLYAGAASIHPQELKRYLTILLTIAIASNVQGPILKIFNQWKLFLKPSSMEKIKRLQFSYSIPTYFKKHLSCTTSPVQQLTTYSYFFEFSIKKMHSVPKMHIHFKNPARNAVNHTLKFHEEEDECTS